ncbi:MAG: winged helix-turn-helix domain-containing protein [Patescibacteria group bacterium]
MLEKLFGSKTRAKLLRIFFQLPDKPYYVRELARMADVQLNAVRRELSNLEDLGLIIPTECNPGENDTATGTTRSKYYRVNGGCLLFFELKSLLLKAQLLQQTELVEKIKVKAGRLKLFVLTGNFSDEKNTETDVLLVGEIKPLVISKLIREFEQKVGKPIRYTVMDEKEFVERMQLGDKFLYSIFEGKHVVVLDEITKNFR